MQIYHTKNDKNCLIVPSFFAEKSIKFKKKFVYVKKMLYLCGGFLKTHFYARKKHTFVRLSCGFFDW